MNDTPSVKLMTSDELFALPPSKKVNRWLFRGELRESQVIQRNTSHSGATAMLSALLVNKLRTQPKPRGKFYFNEAYFRIGKHQEANVGVDIALSIPEQSANTKRALDLWMARRYSPSRYSPPMTSSPLTTPGRRPFPVATTCPASRSCWQKSLSDDTN